MKNERKKEPCLPRAIFESCLVPSAPKRAASLKNRTPVGRCVGAQQSRDKLWRGLGWLKTLLVVEKRQEIVSARSCKLVTRPLILLSNFPVLKPFTALVVRPWFWRTKIESDFILGVDSPVMHAALSFRRLKAIKSTFICYQSVVKTKFSLLSFYYYKNII